MDDEVEKLCTDCIGNEVFANWIRRNGKRGKCNFNTSHGSKHVVAPVKSFAVYVDEWFRENYGRGEEYPVFEGESDSPTYETHGDPYKFILADELACDDAVIEAISDNLPDADWHDISEGDEAFYDDTANYESLASAQARSDEYWYESQFTYQWDDFCKAVQYERRFFRVKEQLDELFGRPEEYSAGKTKPVYMLRRGTILFRCRILDDRFTKDELNAAPAISLGAPPPDRSTPGRMNVEFIPAFYGAFSRDAAIADFDRASGITSQLAALRFTATSRSLILPRLAAALRTPKSWSTLGTILFRRWRRKSASPYSLTRSNASTSLHKLWQSTCGSVSSVTPLSTGPRCTLDPRSRTAIS